MELLPEPCARPSLESSSAAPAEILDSPESAGVTIVVRNFHFSVAPEFSLDPFPQLEVSSSH
jgi:hypothetical protein